MELTPEQFDALCAIYYNGNNVHASIEAIIKEYDRMMAENHTLRIIEAPKGYTFHKNYAKPVWLQITNVSDTTAEVQLRMFLHRPNPPELAPVCVTTQITVADVYGKGAPPTLPNPSEWHCKFGYVDALRAEGYTHMIRSGVGQHLGPVSIELVHPAKHATPKICCKKLS